MPTVANTTTSDKAVVRVNVLSVNLQGMKGKHAYVEQQLEWKGIQIAFFSGDEGCRGHCLIKTIPEAGFAFPGPLGNCDLV